jgi:peroxiredoxin
MALFLPDPQYSLRELSEAQPATLAAGRRDGLGRDLWDLTLKSPDGKTAFVVSISPAHGYAIAETQVTRTAGAANFRNRNQVLEFQQPVLGVFVPKIVRNTMSWAPAIIVETVFHDVQVNTAIADKEFALRFPEGIRVADAVRNVQYVWGKSVPARTFKTVQEYNEWTLAQLNLGTIPAKELVDQSSRLSGEYQALSAEFKTEVRKFVQAVSAAKAPEGRRQPAQQLRPSVGKYAARFLDLAAKDPDDPAALQAMADAIILGGSQGRDFAQGIDSALELLQKHWARNPAIAKVLLPVGFSLTWSPRIEPLLREVLAHNPGREAQGHAALALASLLFALSDFSRWHSNQASEGEGLESDSIRSQLDRARDPAALLREAEQLMTRVASEYPDVKLHPARPRESQTLDRVAWAWLRQDDAPFIGQPAPPITGTDLNGQALRLSDYRGKVVVVIFWASWCRPCMAMISEEKALAHRLASQPFALLGVNCDATPSKARAVVTAQSIPWPNWHDGVPTEGKISGLYRVAGHGVPAIFVIDRLGLLRHKWVASSPELNRIVESLVGESPSRTNLRH